MFVSQVFAPSFFLDINGLPNHQCLELLFFFFLMTLQLLIQFIVYVLALIL